MKDKDQKFTVISNKKVIKKIAAVADSNISDTLDRKSTRLNSSH